MWNKIVIRKKTTDIVLIPEGATDNTWVDYWMDGHYSTLIRSDNDNYLELSLTLHVPSFKSESWYMIWFSLFDEPLTIQKNDFTNYYETYQCSIKHSDKSLQGSANGKNEQSEMFWNGYRGKIDFRGVQGVYNEIADTDSTTIYPWYQDLYQSLII